VKILLLAVLLGCVAMPALAADTPIYIPGHEGQTLVELNGRITWLDQVQIDGTKTWFIELKCFYGETLVKESGLSAVDGYTGFAQGSSGTFSRNPYTGRYQHRSRYGFLAFIDARDPDHYLLTGSDLFLQPLLAQAKAFAYGDLVLYVHCEGADRFEARIYSSSTPGYSIDDTRPIPIATRLDAMPRQPDGQLRGSLDPNAPPIYGKLQDRLHGTLMATEDGGLMIIDKDGRVQRVVMPLPRPKVKE
jgi:hypothetical protein